MTWEQFKLRKIDAVECAECGSSDIRFSQDAVTSLRDICFVIEKDGTLGVRTGHQYGNELRKLYADNHDLSLMELASCESCTLEGDGFDFVKFRGEV